jgi:hypothetical protein
LLIEVNGNLIEHRNMVEYLHGQGFVFDWAQVKRAERKSGPFQGVAEYIFTRKK